MAEHAAEKNPIEINARLIATRRYISSHFPRSNHYMLTPEGIRVAVFYTKLQNRLLRPLLSADKPPAPPEIRRALTTLERAVADHVTAARLAAAA